MKTFDVPFRSLCVSAMLLGVSGAFAQTPVDLSGIVYDQDNKPRVGVIVSLATDLVDTTGADGKWTIQGQIVPVKQAVVRSANLRWLGGDLVTQFDAPILVSADLFDAAGRRLANLPARMVLSGTQSIPLNLPAASGARWLRVRTGNTSTVLSAHSGVQAPSIALPAGLARASGIVDQILSYSFQGQIVTEDQLPSLIQSGLLKWIQDYRVSAPIALDTRVKVDSVWAWFKGGSMAKPIRARMACDTINQLISGRVYTVKSQDAAAVYAFRTWINVYGNGNRLTAVSDTIGFTTLFGDIAWTRGFSLGNAFPDGSILSTDSVEAGNGLNLSLRLAYLDTANHRVKDSVIKAEWDLADGMGWRASASLPPVAVAKWNASGFDTVKLRVMDADSNVAIITKAIKVVNSGSALRLTSGPADTVITPSDTVSFQLFVRDTSGVARVIWSYGDGKVDTTKTGSVHAVKHGYPGPSVVVVGKDSTFSLTVTVIDSLGGSTTQKLSNVKVANVVLTGTVTGPTTGLVNTVYPFVVTVVPAGKKIVHAEWDLGDGQGWRAGSATGYQAKWMKPGSYTAKVRLTDKDSNVVTLTANPIVVTNTKSSVSIASIVDSGLAIPGVMDTIVTPGDTVKIALTVSDVNGVSKVLWNFGDGMTDSTKGQHTLKHVYPGVTDVPVNTAIRFPLGVQVIDSLGDTTVFSQLAVIKDTNDVPVLVPILDSVRTSYVGSVFHIKVAGTSLQKAINYEWSVNGGVFTRTVASDTAIIMPDSMTVQHRLSVRVVNRNGNISDTRTMRIIGYGLMIDSRDGQKYRFIKIGTQTWMAQNLNYQTDSSWCFSNEADSCSKYGRTYQWASALKLATSYNASVLGGSDNLKQGICPTGWHLPRNAEWDTLATFIGGDPVKLKSTSGWKNDRNGTDIYGFRAIPTWARGSDGVFTQQSGNGGWWSATEYGANDAWFSYVGNTVGRYGLDNYKAYGYSLRCVQN
jgi:uncharacterized protein (TIGR02145 family)